MIADASQSAGRGRIVHVAPAAGSAGVDEEVRERWPLLLGVALERASLEARILGSAAPGEGAPPASRDGDLIAASRLARGSMGQYLLEVCLRDAGDYREIGLARREAYHPNAFMGAAAEVARDLETALRGGERPEGRHRMRRIAIFRFLGPKGTWDPDPGAALALDLEYALDEALFARGVAVEARPERVGRRERDPRFLCAEFGADAAVYGTWAKEGGELTVEVLVGHRTGWVVGLRREDRRFRIPSGPPGGAFHALTLAVVEDLGFSLGPAERERCGHPWAEDRRVWADLHRGREAQVRGRMVRALECFRRAYEVASAEREGRGLATSALILGGWDAPRLGDEAQRSLLSQAADEYGRVGDHRGRAAALLKLGRLLGGQGRPAEAEKCLREALAVSRRLRDGVRAGLVLLELAELATGDGRVMAYLHRARERFRSAGALPEEGWTLLRLAWRLRRDAARATAHLEESYRLSVEAGDPHLEEEVGAALTALRAPPRESFIRGWLERRRAPAGGPLELPAGGPPPGEAR